MVSAVLSFFRRDFGYSPLHRLLEIAAILSFFFFVALILTRSYHGLSAMGWQTAAWIVPVAAIVGYAGADFASGFVHWLGDTFGDEDMPVLGKRFIKPFRDHHTYPQGIVEHDYVQVNGNNSMILALFMMLVTFLFNDPNSTLHMLVMTTCVSFTCGVFMTNQFHKWSHMENPPALAVLLQKSGLALGPAHHDVHHTAPFDTYYCITCGWWNPLLQRLRFFENLEQVAYRVLGIRTARDKEASQNG